MFEITQAVQLANLNARAEKHGDDAVSAMDLKFTATVPNTIMNMFHAELRDMLFKKQTDPDLLDELEPDAVTLPRFGNLSPIGWEWEGTGYTVKIAYGLGGNSDIVLKDVKVDKFKFTPLNGGSVDMSFRVVAHPTEEEAGKLYLMIQQSVDITVTAPEPTKVEELFAPA